MPFDPATVWRRHDPSLALRSAPGSDRRARIQIELFLERNGYSQIRTTRFFRRLLAFVLVPLWEVDSGGDWVKKFHLETVACGRVSEIFSIVLASRGGWGFKSYRGQEPSVANCPLELRVFLPVAARCYMDHPNPRGTEIGKRNRRVTVLIQKHRGFQ